jgi:hypothetical protein
MGGSLEVERLIGIIKDHMIGIIKDNNQDQINEYPVGNHLILVFYLAWLSVL